MVFTTFRPRQGQEQSLIFTKLAPETRNRIYEIVAHGSVAAIMAAEELKGSFDIRSLVEFMQSSRCSNQMDALEQTVAVDLMGYMDVV
jgi:hypothetical protein